MTLVSPTSHFFKVGGSLGFNHPSYVTRKADHELLNALRDRQFCYVFNCRQMGKSSLRVRSMQLLHREGMLCGAIDLTMLGSDSNPQQWYGGIITQLFQSFSLVGAINLKHWLKEHSYLAPVQQLSQFISAVILPQTGDRPLFIFVDEIDKILSLEFSVDDLFALIRFFYNQRADNPEFQRLTFALFGVATPSDLIQDKTQTLFNIGRAIELRGFSSTDVQPLAMGLTQYCDRPKVVLDEILHWTGGQPFLTQKICQLVLQLQSGIPAGQESRYINDLVQSKLITNWEAQDEPVHFKTIRDRLLRSPAKIARQLALYQQILQDKDVKSSSNASITELRLSGLVVQRGERLQLYNRIYAQIFDHNWIEVQLATIRPYAEAMTAWEASHRKDESRLLRGKALGDALQWSASKNLSNEDYQFLAASQELDKQTALAQERRRQDVERLELELLAEQKAKAELSQAYQTAQKRLKMASIILVASIIGAAIATGWLGYVLRREQMTQVESLKWAGKGALSQFNFSQINALLTAMEASEQLLSQMQPNQPLEDYPTQAPITALQSILDRIQEQNYLVGHQESIHSVSISPNGQFIATASRDGTAKIWNSQGTEIRTLSPQNGAVYDVSFSPDNQKIATAAQDGTVIIWAIDGTVLHTLEHASEVYSVQFSHDARWIATASKDGVARLWHTNGIKVTEFRGHQQAIYGVEFSPDSQQILTASKDGTAKVWNLDGQLMRSLSSQKTLYAASFSPDSKTIVTAGEAGILELWTDNQVTKRMKGHDGAIYDVGFDPTGKFLASASADETVKLWSISGQQLQVLQGYQGAVYATSFSPQHPLLVTASHDKKAKVWDFSRSPLIPHILNQTDVAALSLVNQRDLITAFAGGRVMIESLQSQSTRSFQVKSSSAIYDIVVHPTKPQLIIAFKDGHIEVRDFKGKTLRKFQAHPDIIYSVAIHPEGNLIATASKDQSIKIWTLSGELQNVIRVHSGAVYDVDFSPDGTFLVSASSDETSKILSLDGQPQSILTGHQGEIHQVKFHPDHHYLVTVSTDETARLWNLAGEEIRQFEHDAAGLIFRVAISPDGQTIATGARDGSISLWSLDGRLLDQFRRHQSLIMDLQFTHDNQLISIAQDDQKATLWPQSNSISKRLEHLLGQGCEWLKDYLKHQPTRMPASCRLPS